MVKTLFQYREKPTFLVVVCPDEATALNVWAIDLGFLPPLKAAMQSDDGRYAWSSWEWPTGFLDKAQQLGATIYPYADGAWKKAANWTDKPVPPPAEISL